MNCLFCNIANNKITANILYHDEQVIAFDDINPQAPVHKIIIPVKHIETFNDIVEQDQTMLAHLMQVIAQLAKQLAIDQTGYRVVLNCNAHGGQSVFHIHWHLLGGRRLHWPPG